MWQAVLAKDQDVVGEDVREVADVDRACAMATREASTGDRIVTFGSFQIVGPAMAALAIYFPPSSGEDSAKWTGA